MAFQQGAETGRLTKDVDEFLRGTLEQNRAIGANLAVTLGSFMLPGAMGVKGGGPPKHRPGMNFLRYVGKKGARPKAEAGKPSIRPEEAANIIPFSRARPKGYTRVESGNLSGWVKQKGPQPGTSGKGEGYGVLRRSAEYNKPPPKTPTDPHEYIVKRAFDHFNQLTPAEKMRMADARPETGFKDSSDLYEMWQARFDTGHKDQLPKDIYNAFSKMLKEEQVVTKGAPQTRDFVREAVKGDPKRSMTKQALDLGRELFEGKVDKGELEAAHAVFKSMWKDNPDLVMKNQYFTEAFEFAEILGGKTAGKEGKIKLMQMSGDLPADFGF